MLCKELLSVSSCVKPEPKDRCVHSRRNVDSSFEFKMWSWGVVVPTSLYKQREECGRRAYALTTKSHGQVGKRKNHLDDYFTSYGARYSQSTSKDAQSAFLVPAKSPKYALQISQKINHLLIFSSLISSMSHLPCYTSPSPQAYHPQQFLAQNVS